MKTNIGRWALLGACSGLTLLAAVSAQSQQSGFYIKGDLGGNLTQDTDLKEFFGASTTGAKVKFDPGFRAGFAGGYQLTDWFAPELEVGFMANRIHSITGATRLHDASFANAPLLLNAKFQYPNTTPFTPYVGAGVGGSEAVIDADRIEFGGARVHGNDADTVFAYQAFAGLRYQLNDRMGLSVEYRYFAADSPTWEGDFRSGVGADSMSFGRSQTHSVSLAFEFRF